MAASASAQPADPYAAPVNAKPGEDPVLNEQIAESLVQRAQELLDAKVYLDAKQLAVEAMVRSAHGTAAEQAKLIIHKVNVQLGIPEEDGPPINPPGGKLDLRPIQDPTITNLEQPPPQPVMVDEHGGGHVASMVHTGLYAGLIGTTIGSLFSRENPAAGAVPMGLAFGIAGGLYLPRLVDRLHWSEAQVRTVGSASVWGGVVGGFIADISTGHTTGREVLVGASIGATASMIGGAFYASSHPLSRGDVALVDTFAGIGALGGLTIGMLMQPAQGEAYSLNAVLGATGGIVVALIAAPSSNTTQRRMLRVAGLALAGGALPFLLYAAIHDPTTSGDERITGLLASCGLVGGAYLGFRLTDHMDEGLDTLDGKPTKPAGDDDAPPAIVGRNSDGRWGLSGIGIAPLSPALAPQKGMAFSVLGGTF